MAGIRFSRAVSVFAVVALLLALVVPIGADDVIEVFPDEDSTVAEQAAPTANGDLWFVELKSPPTADGTALAAVKAEKDAFRGNAKKATLNYTERFAFDTLWNGLAIKVDPAQVSTLRRIDGVAAIYPIEAIAIPAATTDNGADLATAIKQTGADIAQTTLGLSGAGVKVAIMDTGVDYHHPDLGGCFGPTCRVKVGHDFVGSAFAGPASTPAPDDDPDDCNGHGTHVAGIVGANGGVKGVAPDVTFGAYRVFGCEGSTTADIMIAAMERALADGMQILNMSIGSARQSWPNYPTAAASDRAVNKGMVVVASIGNSGGDGAYSAGAPGVGKKVIGVASFDNSHINVLSFIVNPSGQRVGYLPLSTTPAPPRSGTTPEIVHVGRGCNVDTYLGSPSGKVALIERGLCSFQEKYQRAANAGATGVLIYNSSAGLFAGGGVTSRGIFGVAVSRADGLHIRSLTAPNLTWTDQRINVVNPTGNLISSFSSYGLAADLSLKPDIGAPGGLIRSTYPVEKGSYATISGTSMSSPHVAGGVALLLQARPATNANTVRSILQNSADPKVWSGNPSLGFLDYVHRQGAGMLDIDDAILATTLIEPGKLSLGESQAGATTQTLSIRNTASSDVTYSLSRVNALSTTGSTHTPGTSTGNASVVFTQAGLPVTSVTVPAGATATVDATVTPATGPNRAQYGGYIVLTPQGGGQTYRVPYAGFVGDYQTITALTPTACPVALPAIGEKGTSRFCRVGSDVPFTLPAADRTFTLAGGDVPYIVFHLDHQVRRVRIEVFDAVTNASFHRVGDFDYLGRNTADGYLWVTWDGDTTNGKKTYTVPNGQYVLKMSVLKALGDPADPAHTETWTSPVITIARPAGP